MRFLRLQILIMVAAAAAYGQDVHPVTAVDRPGDASVIFKFDWSQGHPWVSYTISVDGAGKAHFQGIGNTANNGDGDPFSQDFVLSDGNRQKIFDLAKGADFFQGTLEAKAKNIAKTGQKTLEYHGMVPGDSKPLNSSAVYNYSESPDVQELTRLFQAIATTIDFGRKLAFQYRFDKLGLDARLNSLKDMQASHFAEELQAIEPILQKIASDPNMMHINRLTAKQLLKSIGPTAALASPATQP